MAIINSVVIQKTGQSVTIDPINITPTTSAQTITSTGYIDGYAPINVSAVTSSIDSNITANNIKNGVTILGVTGNYTGGGGGTGYSIDRMNNNGTLTAVGTTNVMDFTGITTIDGYALQAAYAKSNVTSISNFGENVTTINIAGCQLMFYQCTQFANIAVNLSNLVSVATESCRGMFQQTSGITSAIIGASTGSINSTMALGSMFSNSSSLTTATVQFAVLTGQQVCYQMFSGCSNLTSATFNYLNSVTNSSALGMCFQSCYNLRNVYFPALTSTSFGSSYTNQFNNMLYSVNGCTLHFPSALDPAGGSTVISSLQGYPNFGGTNTICAFDL